MPPPASSGSPYRTPRPRSTPPTPAALQALDRLLAYARAKHRLPRTALYTHREVAESNCPGALLQSEIEKRR